ncbi:MAG TPA: hypothetical protein VNE17_06160 [Nitrolancea sp.]|nr:hypothetical protein [Nitrolancea sp.]
MNKRGRASTRGPRVGAYILSLIIGLVFLTACSGPSTGATSEASVVATTTAATGGSATGTTVATASSTLTSVATATSAGTPAPTTASVSTAPAATTPAAGDSTANYLDDRSSAEEVIYSYYSAINGKQYARAYSYWASGTSSADLPPFAQFQQGYTTTRSVQVTIGSVSGGVGAGQLYYSVPVVLNSTTTDKGDQTFVGCYTLHLGNPAIQTEPPYHPLAIQQADVAQVTGNASVKDMLATACKNQQGESPILGTPSSDPNDIAATRYLDNRTSGIDEIRSYYNAINRKEYARAYSYWESNVDSSQLPAFAAFQQGYAATASVKLTLGSPVNGAGAGQLYTSVPATIVAKMTDGSTQTFVGCYTTHLAQPAIQSTPPFQPLGIQKAQVKKVANGANTASLMAQACQP